MTGSTPFPNPERVDALAGQFSETSVYTDARTELYEKRAIPPIDFMQLGLKALQLEGNERILEVGCGKGGFARRLDSLRFDGLNFSGEMTSTDVSPSTFNVTELFFHDRPNFKFVQADARNLPFSDNSFNRYVCRYLLYLVGDPEAAIAEAKRVTEPRGTLIFDIRGVENFHRHAKSVDKVLEHLGFEPVGSPYASFDSEAAPGILGRYFELVPELSYPQALDASSVREVRLLAEDWHLYKYSLYGTIRAAIMAQLGLRINILEEDSEAPPPEHKDILRGINRAIDMLVWPDYETEINDHGFYHETAQDRLITCINTKEEQSLET